ncbi:MAG TPA: universal stress protein [Methylomirabilota bacterium]|jgi:nucleotide-binding universal stress UspA family protein
MGLSAVLFPTDFSPASEAAGRVARVLTRQSRARLHVIHVVVPGADLSLAAEGLVRVAESLGSDLRVEPALICGPPGLGIVEYAREHRIDLISMGARTRSSSSRGRLGSVARTVAELAPCHVLTVPDADPDAPERDGDLGRCSLCRAPAYDSVCERCRERIQVLARQPRLPMDEAR